MSKFFIGLSFVLTVTYLIEAVALWFGYKPSTLVVFFSFLTCSLLFLGSGLNMIAEKLESRKR